MSAIVVVLPKIEDAKKIRNILNNHGFLQVFACGTASAALQEVGEHDCGVVISGYHLRDMYYLELAECLPKNFELILLGSANVIKDTSAGLLSLEVPLKVHDLINPVQMVLSQLERRTRKEKKKKRNDWEEKYIRDAKRLLMERNHLSEEEAHRYIQKSSMDNSIGMVETAQMILTLFEQNI